jgi:hypothetical protein
MRSINVNLRAKREGPRAGEIGVEANLSLNDLRLNSTLKLMRHVCAHQHDCEASECSSSFSLYKHLNSSSLRCLNCTNQDLSILQRVFRPWGERLNELSPPLTSNEEEEDDERELLIHVEFDGAVKLSAITLIGGDESSSPSKMRAFINREDLNFEEIRTLNPTQSWELQHDPLGILEYPTQAHKFQGVTSLDIHLQGSFGAGCLSINFIGLKGTFTERKRQAVEAVYEARAMPSDHKTKSDVRGASYGV